MRNLVTKALPSEDHINRDRVLIKEYKGLKIYQRTPWGPALLPAIDFSDEIAPIHLFKQYAMRYTVYLKPDGLTPLVEVTDPEEAGRRCRMVNACINSKTCGWVNPPTSSEFYDALRATAPSSRQTAIVRMWASETEPVQMFVAWLQRCYSWKVLVESLHRNECHRRGSLNQYLNRFSMA